MKDVHTVSMILKDIDGEHLQSGNIQIKDIKILSELYGKSAVLIMYEELMSRDAIEREELRKQLAEARATIANHEGGHEK